MSVTKGGRGDRQPAARLPVARVCVDVPLAHLDRPFDYLVAAADDEAAQPGVRVKVRFAGQLVGGFLLERAESSPHGGKLAYLDKVVSAERVLDPEVARLARAVADRYAGNLSDVLRLAVPPRHARVESQATPDPACRAGRWCSDGSPCGTTGCRHRAGAGDRSPHRAPRSRLPAAEPAAPSRLPGRPAWPCGRRRSRSAGAVGGADGPAGDRRMGGAPTRGCGLSAGAGGRAGRPGRLVGAAGGGLAGADRRGRRRHRPGRPRRRHRRRRRAGPRPARPGADRRARRRPARRAERRRRAGRAIPAVPGREPASGAGGRRAPGRRCSRRSPSSGLVVIWDDGDDLHAEPRAPYPHAREVLLTRAQLADCAALVGGFARTGEGQQLLETGWAKEIVADRDTLRARVPARSRRPATIRSWPAIPGRPPRGCPAWPGRRPGRRCRPARRCWCRCRGAATCRRWRAPSAARRPAARTAPGRWAGRSAGRSDAATGAGGRRPTTRARPAAAGGCGPR